MKTISRKSLRRKTTPTLASALERYLAEISVAKRGGHNEHSLAKVWLKTPLSQRPIGSIFSADLIRMRDEWLLSLKPATVVRRLAIISHLYTVARKDWGMSMLANPVQLVRRPVVQNGRTRRIYTRIMLRGVPTAQCPRNELEWLVNATRSPELPIIMALATETGMRRSEIAGIRRENIDLVHGTIFLAMTKNGDSRFVPLTPLAKHLLRQFVANKPTRGEIFSISPEAITRAFIRAREKARRQYEDLCHKYGRKPRDEYFNDLRFHDLRHESTSMLATVFEMHELAKVTGHKDTRMLLRYYHPHGRELAQKLARSALGKRQIEKLRNARGQEAGHV
ncbi:site-specific integrase [Pusillimonas sp. NJUB218]|uniref:site-specific integrase n=1 Tax=Pusillimonas sp. NJUB218 TaxID=2023230 RepID=UPI000F4BD588|nr:tyrosine-type recombinase/integrase [Pusillimonas sp. NJUB218]ROT46337.1 integrase [Pusillimonas sp. NJUB218]